MLARGSLFRASMTVELACFVAIGLAASATHFVAALVLIERVGLAAWLANIVAFLCALPVSYLGHSLVTFPAKTYGRDAALTKRSFRRFTLLALSGFAVNQTSVLIFIEQLGWPHRPVLLVTILVVAGGIFSASKVWAFAASLARG